MYDTNSVNMQIMSTALTTLNRVESSFPASERRIWVERACESDDYDCI